MNRRQFFFVLGSLFIVPMVAKQVSKPEQSLWPPLIKVPYPVNFKVIGDKHYFSDINVLITR